MAGAGARLPKIKGCEIGSAAILYTADLLAVASSLTREQYQAFVLMTIDREVFGTDPEPEQWEGFEAAREAYEALRPNADAARNYVLTTDRSELAKGATIADLYGDGIAEWFEG